MTWLSAFSALLKLIPFLTFIQGWLERRAETQRAAEAADTAIAKEEARVATTAAEVMAERRDDRAGVDRLRDGSF